MIHYGRALGSLLSYFTITSFKPAMWSVAHFHCSCIQIWHVRNKGMDWKCSFATYWLCTKNTFNRNWSCGYRSILLLQTEINPYQGMKSLKMIELHNLIEKMGYNASIKIIADLSEDRCLPSLHHVISRAEFPCYWVLLCKHLVACLNLPVKYLQNNNC